MDIYIHTYEKSPGFVYLRQHRWKSVSPVVSLGVLIQTCGSTRPSDLDGPYPESARLEKTRQGPSVICSFLAKLERVKEAEKDGEVWVYCRSSLSL